MKGDAVLLMLTCLSRILSLPLLKRHRYVNHWDTQSYMVSVDDKNLKWGGTVLKHHIWNAARDTIQEWTGQQLAECSLYGIRVYKEGAVLAPHVDRLPLVSSAIINVDQDVDEPWYVQTYILTPLLLCSHKVY